MALTYAQMDAVTEKLDVGRITQQSYDTHYLTQKLTEGGRVKTVTGGTKVYHPIRYKQLGTSSFIDPDSARVVENVPTRTAFELDWTYMVVNLVMTWDEKVKNRGESAIISLIDDKITEAGQDQKQVWSDKLYQAQASKASTEIDGLYQIIQDTDSDTTYAGISSGDASDWKAGFFNSSTTSLGLFGSNSLEEMIRSCTFDDRPDLIVTTRTIAGLYAEKLQPSERRQPMQGKTGAYEGYGFMGVPIMPDAQCPTGDIILLSTNHLWLYVQSDFNFVRDGWKEDPSGYHRDVNMISWVGNLVCDRRKNFGAFTGITS